MDHIGQSTTNNSDNLVANFITTSIHHLRNLFPFPTNHIDIPKAIWFFLNTLQ